MHIDSFELTRTFQQKGLIVIMNIWIQVSIHSRSLSGEVQAKWIRACEKRWKGQNSFPLEKSERENLLPEGKKWNIKIISLVECFYSPFPIILGNSVLDNTTFKWEWGKMFCNS